MAVAALKSAIDFFSMSLSAFILVRVAAIALWIWFWDGAAVAGAATSTGAGITDTEAGEETVIEPFGYEVVISFALYGFAGHAGAADAVAKVGAGAWSSVFFVSAIV